MTPRESPSEAVEPLFPVLPSGSSKLDPSRVADHQIARLQGAMLEAVGRDGFASVTLNELVSLAGVSKTTFYEHFDNKLDLFLATFDEIIRQVSEQVGEAYRRPGDPRERLVAALRRFMDLVIEEPAAARLTAVESLTLGAAGVAHREKGSEAFEVLIRQSYEHSRSRIEVSDILVRAVVGGIRGVIYRHLRSNQIDALPGMVEELVEWALSYQRPSGKAVNRALKTAARGPSEVTVEAIAQDEEVPWEDPPDSRRSRRALSQRERMVRAAARVVVDKGYEALSIPAISAAAGTSNQTFYQHFTSKRDAFLAAFELISADALRVAGGAFAAEGERPEAIGAGIRALLEYFSRRELFASLVFFELPSAGPVALDQADAALEDFTAFLRPGVVPGAFGEPLPAELLPAIASGIWSTIQYEIAHGRRSSLPGLAPEITRIAVGPFARRKTA